MRLWARVGLGVVVGFIVLAGVTALRPKPEVTVACRARGDSGACVLDNKGGRTGQVQFDAVLVCHDGEHVAHVAGDVPAHGHVTKVIDGFGPSVGLLSRCAGIDYRGIVVK